MLNEFKDAGLKSASLLYQHTRELFVKPPDQEGPELVEDLLLCYVLSLLHPRLLFHTRDIFANQLKDDHICNIKAAVLSEADQFLMDPKNNFEPLGFAKSEMFDDQDMKPYHDRMVKVKVEVNDESDNEEANKEEFGRNFRNNYYDDDFFGEDAWPLYEDPLSKWPSIKKENGDSKHGIKKRKVNFGGLGDGNPAKKKRPGGGHKRRYCEHCDYSTLSRKVMVDHMANVHKDAPTFSCEKCPYTAISLEELSNHNNLKHVKVQGKIHCELCDYQAPAAYSMKSHMANRHGIGESFPCDKCDYKAWCPAKLRDHVRVKHEGFFIQCEYCDHRTDQKGSMKKHVDAKHKKIRYPCTQCDLTFGSEKYMKDHIRVKHEGFRWRCDQCEFATTKANTLKEHVRVVHMGIKFLCDQCDYQGNTSNLLREHMAAKHMEAFACPHCDYSAVTIRWLKEHIKNKHPELKGGDLQCDRCEFSTNTYKSLNIHISIVHNSDNPRPETVMVKKEGKDGEYIVYKKGSKAPAACSECDFVAADSGALKTHKAFKHKIGDLKCDECDFVGAWSHQLDQHKKEHGVYGCDQCSYIATLAKDLKKHIKYKHTNAYPCDQCEYAATRADALRVHKESVHDKIRWPCDLCDRICWAKSDLHKHKKKMHGPPPMIDRDVVIP